MGSAMKLWHALFVVAWAAAESLLDDAPAAAQTDYSIVAKNYNDDVGTMGKGGAFTVNIQGDKGQTGPLDFASGPDKKNEVVRKKIRSKDVGVISKITVAADDK